MQKGHLFAVNASLGWLNFAQSPLIKGRVYFDYKRRAAILGLSDSYPAFFLLIATTSNKNFLKVQKL
jgi:hypothetical protein